MRILEDSPFKKAVKRLHDNQKRDLFEAIQAIMEQPAIGKEKVGDLTGMRVYKFRMVNQLTLIAYKYEEESATLKLFAVGSHENFYRDLKRD